MQLIEVSKDHSFGEKKFKVNGSSLIVNLVKLENLKVFDGFSSQNAQVGSELLHKDNGTTPKREARFLRQKNKGVQSAEVQVQITELLIILTINLRVLMMFMAILIHQVLM